jgi:CO/xanthine dehydrogenase FAD-binding subunit
MDAAIELRDGSGSRWAGIHALISDDNRPYFPPSALLTRVRIPTAPWDATALHPLGEAVSGQAYPATFAAAARFEKDTLSELRLVAAGLGIVRDRALELSLIGKRLPLAARDVDAAEAAARAKSLEVGFGRVLAGHYGRYVASFLSGIQEEGR